MANNSSLINYYVPEVITANDYYPGGMMMPGRKYQANPTSFYRYSINGQEKESELNENITSAEFWMYDSRIGRRWNLDPIYKASESRYLVFGDNPIYYRDPQGDFRTKFGAYVHKFFNGTKGRVDQSTSGKNKGEWYIQQDAEVKGNGDGKNRLSEIVVYGRVYGNNSKKSGLRGWNPFSTNQAPPTGGWFPRSGNPINLLDESAKKIQEKLREIKAKAYDYWNSPLARFAIPDFIQLSGGGSTGSFIFGGGELNLVLITRGKKPGLYYNAELGGGVATGVGTGVEVMVGTGYFLGETKNIDLSTTLGGNEVSLALDTDAVYGIPIEGEGEIGFDENNKPNSIMFKRGLATKAWNLAPVTMQAGASKASNAKPILTTKGFFK